MSFATTQFIGNQRVVDFFSRVIAAGRLHQTYVLTGPSQVGKETLARVVAAQLLKVTVSALTVNPDFTFVERLHDEKTGRRKKELSVEQARALKTRVQQSAWGGGYKVVVVDGADTLSEEAGNALLKILEEAPERTVFFLLCLHEDALLSTIRSRAEFLRLTPVPLEEIAQGLQGRGFAGALAEEAVQASFGRPGRALDFVLREEIRVAYGEERTRFDNFFGQPFFKRVKTLEEWFGKGEETPLERDELDATLELWTLWWSQKMREEVENGGSSAWPLVQMIDRIKAAREDVRRNIHPRLVVENLVLKF